MGKRGKQGHLPQVLIPYDEDSTQNRTASRTTKTDGAFRPESGADPVWLPSQIIRERHERRMR
jgi:hypothetical protein